MPAAEEPKPAQTAAGRCSTFLAGQRVTLRPLEPEDVPMLSMVFNHPETHVALFEHQPMSDSQVLDKIRAWQSDPNTVMMAICEAATGRAAGVTGLVRIDWMSRAGVFFIAIADPADWSKGFGGEATQLIADYAFDTLNLQRIQLHVWVKNEKGVRAYQRAGYEIEGTLRRAMYHAGEYEDFYVMGKLRPM